MFVLSGVLASQVHSFCFLLCIWSMRPIRLSLSRLCAKHISCLPLLLNFVFSISCFIWSTCTVWICFVHIFSVWFLCFIRALRSGGRFSLQKNVFGTTGFAEKWDFPGWNCIRISWKLYVLVSFSLWHKLSQTTN